MSPTVKDATASAPGVPSRQSDRAGAPNIRRPLRPRAKAPQPSAVLTLRGICRVALLLIAAQVLQGCASRSEPGERAPGSQVKAPSLQVPVTWTDITRAAGIGFVHNNGARGAMLLPETMGSGAAFLDYDGDGYQDLFLVNGRDWTSAEVEAYQKGTGRGHGAALPQPLPSRRSSCVLLHNERGVFRDVTRQAGLAEEMYGMGAAVGDYDNDGRPDLYVTGVGRNYLFHNESTARSPRFREVAGLAGAQDKGWSTSAAWLDYDRDGRLDLFVCHYLKWSPARDIYMSFDGRNKSYTPPELAVGEPSRLFHNESRGSQARFVDVSDKAGISRQPATANLPARSLPGKSLGVAVGDVNQDGWPDLVVANDGVPNSLFVNNKHGAFLEVGVEQGIAYSAEAKARGGMGIDLADADHSGRDTVVIGNFSNQMLGLYQQSHGSFIDRAKASGVGAASQSFLTFGCGFFDIDNDGWPDIVATNGHVDKIWANRSEGGHYAQRPLLFYNDGSGRFTERGMISGPPFTRPIVGRGLAAADIDLDGDLDLLLTSNGGPPLLMRNEGGNKNHVLRLELQGSRSNRSAIGARVEVSIGKDVVRRTVRSGSSYLSQSELPLTFGLGRRNLADSIAIHWPSGTTTRLQNVPANQSLVIREGISQPAVRRRWS